MISHYLNQWWPNSLTYIWVSRGGGGGGGVVSLIVICKIPRRTPVVHRANPLITYIKYKTHLTYVHFLIHWPMDTIGGAHLNVQNGQSRHHHSQIWWKHCKYGIDDKKLPGHADLSVLPTQYISQHHNDLGNDKRPPYVHLPPCRAPNGHRTGRKRRTGTIPFITVDSQLSVKMHAMMNKCSRLGSHHPSWNTMPWKKSRLGTLIVRNAPLVIVMTTSSVASDYKIVVVTGFPFQWSHTCRDGKVFCLPTVYQ